MLKVVACCGSGMGSSMMIKIKLEKYFKKHNLQAQIAHTNIGEAKSTATNYDLIVCSDALKDTFTQAKEKGVAVIPLINLMDEKELSEKLDALDFGSLEKYVHV